MNELASRYALSLYELALESKELSSWQEEGKELQKLLKDNPEFIKLLSNAYLSLDERYELLDKTLSGIREEFISLFKIVIKNHRENILIDILDAFNSYANEYRGVKEGLVYTTEPLDTKTKAEIEKAVGKVENCKVELHNLIDHSLIGGLKVVINGHIYDSSIKNHLEKMKENLLRK